MQTLHSRPPSPPPKEKRIFFFHTLAIGLITILLAMLYHGLTGHSPLVLFGVGILISTWNGGARAGLLATVIFVPIMYYFFVTPPITFLVETLPDMLAIPVLGGIGLVISILEARRHATMQAVELERRRLHVILQGIPVGVIVVRASTRKLFIANDAAHRIMRIPDKDDMTLQDVMQSPAFTAYNPQGQPYDSSNYPLSRALRTGETVYREIMELRASDAHSMHPEATSMHPEATSTYLEATAAPVRGERGDILSGVMIFDDISARRQSEERLRLLHEMTMEHSRALTVEQVARIALLKGQAAFGAVAGVICLLNDDKTELTPVDSVGYPTNLVARWTSFSVDLKLPMPCAVREKHFTWTQADEAQRRVNTQHLSWCGMPLVVDDETIGAMGFSFKTVRPFSDDEREFALTLANHSAQSLQRALLTDRLKSGAAQEERQRLARDLHDAVSQSLFASSALAESIQRKIYTEPEAAARLADEVLTLNRAALAEMRTLLLELRPDAITRYKLPDLLRQLTEAAQAHSSVQTNFDIAPDLALPIPVHIALYRIAQESINNVVKHSEAKTLSLLLKREANAVTLQIEDDGKGFASSGSADGIGMESMHERAASIGANLVIHSEPGKGTCVRVLWDDNGKAAG